MGGKSGSHRRGYVRSVLNPIGITDVQLGGGSLMKVVLHGSFCGSCSGKGHILER